jgi:hypothetical protein
MWTWEQHVDKQEEGYIGQVSNYYHVSDGSKESSAQAHVSLFDQKSSQFRRIITMPSHDQDSQELDKKYSRKTQLDD